MDNAAVYDELIQIFKDRFGSSPAHSAYAPGRVEVLGNHTDYNEGLVLSAAINFGTFFAVSPREDRTCRLVAGDLGHQVTFDLDRLEPITSDTWANYVIGVVAGLQMHGETPMGFDAAFLGNIPLGAGLSSSAALEICSGLALSALYGLDVSTLDLARIGQAAEHEFAGVKCGLLDQISSLYGKRNQLVVSDFRTLEISNDPLGDEACFLMCNTRAKHTLTDGAYNERRASCEAAARFFADTLDHPVTALRDVSSGELARHRDAMDPLAASRAAHVIGETERVSTANERLEKGDLAGFGTLMFESHDSSQHNFENSCPELDAIVDAARKVPGILGARLSGGGFGGSAVVLLHPRDVEHARQAIARDYEQTMGHPCDIRVITPSDGARVL